jgi:hypothetical protein
VIGRATLLRAGLVGIAFAAGCKVDQTAFDNRIFSCDTSAKDPGCGSTSSGDPMVCYPASLLDGTDFCAPSCDPAAAPPLGEVCVEGGAELGFCDPSVTNSCGQTALGCLRTDVTSQEGVCTTMPPCTADEDCTDPVRSTCAATFLTQIYANASSALAGPTPPAFFPDHLYCLQKNCQSGQSSCSPGQSCLPLLVPAGAHAPDICVPNCDSQGNCPPNHSCFQKISGPANPAICIPGLLGFICEADINCLVGKCLSDGDPTPEQGLKLCTIDCGNDADCAIWDSDQGIFSCIGGHCETPNAYRGNSCRTTADCTRDENTICVFQSPPQKATDLGNCLRPCDATTFDCAPRAGIGHSCLPFYGSDGTQAAACFPGFFPYPCTTTANCVGDLTCRGASAGVPDSGNCTTLCQTDADCEADRWTAGQSFCAPQGVCAPLLAGGKQCLSNNQCQSKSCQMTADAGVVWTCAEPTP